MLPRAIETAAHPGPGARASGRGDRRQDCGLCELHPGEADGLVWEDYVERYGAPDWDLDPAGRFAPGGESWISFVDRAASQPSSAWLPSTGANSSCWRRTPAFIEASVLRFLVGSPAGTPAPGLAAAAPRTRR